LETDTTTVQVSLKVVGTLDYLIANLKSSDEIVVALASDQKLYQKDLLNSSKNAAGYTGSIQRSTNLGIYGADLNYILRFGQTQESLKYLIVSKKLAEQLGVALAFDKKVIERYEANTQHKDTLLNIVNTSYANVKKLLKSSDQFEHASLVITGSWIENMYLATETMKRLPAGQKKEQLTQSIWQQKEYLSKLAQIRSDLLKDSLAQDSLAIKIEEIIPIFEQKQDDKAMEALNQKLSALRNGLVRKN
jgi:hypothetical protein